MRTKLPSGNGMFIHRIKDCGGVRAIVETADAYNLKHLLVKFADGREHRQKDELISLVPLAHAAGIEVWVWPYIYGISPDGEAKLEAQWYKEISPDGFVIDAEKEYKNNRKKAVTYITTLRNLLPDEPIGLSSYWWPSMHSNFPWDEFMDGCDFVMPQVYYSSSDKDPVDCLITSINDLKKYHKPIIPTGGDFAVDFKIETMQPFYEYAKAHCKALNWWEWTATNSKIWNELRTMKMEENMAITWDKTRDTSAEVAEYACKRFAEGYRGKFVLGGVSFELDDKGRCSEFVREVSEAGAGTGDHSLPYFGADAKETEKKLKAAGKSVSKPARGVIACFNDASSGQFGHIGICISTTQFAENTSGDRGPGFVISKLSEMKGRVTGYYSILPARKEEVEVKTTEIKVVDHETGSVIQKLKMVEGGNHIADQKKLYVKDK